MRVSREELARDVPVSLAAIAPLGLALGLAAADPLTLSLSLLSALGCGAALLRRLGPAALRAGQLAGIGYGLASALAMTGTALGHPPLVACALAFAEVALVALLCAGSDRSTAG